MKSEIKFSFLKNNQNLCKNKSLNNLFNANKLLIILTFVFAISCANCNSISRSRSSSSHSSHQNENSSNSINSSGLIGSVTETPNDITFIHYPSNNPIEDRYNIKTLKNIAGGKFLSVLDGHGGFNVSDYANSKLADYIDEEYPKQLLKSPNSIKDTVISSLQAAFHRVESELLEKSAQLYQKGQGKLATAGSCALVAVVFQDNIYIANLGDSKASLIGVEKLDNKKVFVTQLMNRHNAEEPEEKKALYKKFPNDKDIVYCKRSNGKVCYVKGRLQCTRTFGDFNLKYKQFNTINEDGYKRVIKNFNGPYISSEPEITVHSLNYDTDKYLLLASDGLGDFVDNNEVSELISKTLENKMEPKAIDLFNRVLEKASLESNLTVEEIKNIPLGSRRHIHDDTTIILYPLHK